jgi:hypothetical protein
MPWTTRRRIPSASRSFKLHSVFHLYYPDIFFSFGSGFRPRYLIVYSGMICLHLLDWYENTCIWKYLPAFENIYPRSKKLT